MTVRYNNSSKRRYNMVRGFLNEERLAGLSGKYGPFTTPAYDAAEDARRSSEASFRKQNNTPMNRAQFTSYESDQSGISYTDSQGNPITAAEYNTMSNASSYLDADGNPISEAEYNRQMNTYAPSTPTLAPAVPVPTVVPVITYTPPVAPAAPTPVAIIPVPAGKPAVVPDSATTVGSGWVWSGKDGNSPVIRAYYNGNTRGFGFGPSSWAQATDWVTRGGMNGLSGPHHGHHGGGRRGGWGFPGYIEPIYANPYPFIVDAPARPAVVPDSATSVGAGWVWPSSDGAKAYLNGTTKPFASVELAAAWILKGGLGESIDQLMIQKYRRF